jgi:ribosomal protein S18 acetylase RimI-like enzyme
MTTIALTAADAAATTAVLCAAFREYPVMRFVLGESADYDQRLATLVGLFVAARVLRGEPMLGVAAPAGGLAAAAILSLPGEQPPPPALGERREADFAALGADARRRYEDFSAAAGCFPVAAAHHHLNMIGVRPAAQGLGHARRLLEATHALAAADPASAGVSLTTELEANVALYRHFGYTVLGATRVSGTLTTWSCFRPVGVGERQGAAD